MLFNGYEIRNAEPRDASGIIKCMQSVMDEKVFLVSDIYFFSERGEKDIIKSPEDLSVVSVKDGEVVGIIRIQRGVYKKLRHTAILSIAILKEHRRFVLGEKMLNLGIEWCRSRGIEKLNLEVFSTNTGAIELYRKLGFREEGRKIRQFKIFDEYADDVLMTLFLGIKDKNRE